MRRCVECVLVVSLAALITRPAQANSKSEALRARAVTEIYNLDRDQAISTFRLAIAADSEDAAAYRGLATALWLSITFRRGNMTVDDYLGRPNRPSASPLPPPPAETVAAYRDAIDKAIAIARKGINANPRDADAHYQLGAAVA